MKGKIKRVFPGGNTSKGFYSYYDYIIEDDANRIFIVKGGPGVGKSSMMKRVAQDLLELGYDIEYHHCSSDNNSIDGIVIPELNVAMIDGTAPHIVDPKNPGAVDEIIHLGDYWNVDKMERNKENVLKTNKEVGRLFRTAYKYLEAAKPIYEDIVDKNSEAMDFGKVNIETQKLIEEILGDINISEEPGKDRHLFGSAYTPKGWVEFTDTILQDAERIYYIKGDIGTGKSTLLERVYKEAQRRGLDVEVYHTPLIPEKIETVFIKGINVGLTISEMFKDDNKKVIDLNRFLNMEVIEKYQSELEYDKEIMNNLIENAIKTIKKAKETHDLLETNYVPNMNFDEVERVRKEIVKRILRYKNRIR
ncbi:PRK06851 family protein [Caloranaerobacter azorensis]|uniref:ATP-binding protein n=1 Tax=Caloranaerobacter azorensis TaxID=116090 RepID=A0A6P1YC00_9FIRM|nr:PRK06851 family protein [Caloranaerobacter azorensis]QIB26624.1 ATP-binding protein [Caloranaerobacter azorensis]